LSETVFEKQRMGTNGLVEVTGAWTGWPTCQAELTLYRLHCSVLFGLCYQGHE